MTRTPPRAARAAAIGLIVLSFLSGTPALAAGGSAGSLTHQYPLGTETLSQTPSSTAPAQASSTPAHRSAPAAAARRPAGHGGIPGWALLALATAVVLVVIAVLIRDWLVVRRSRLVPRPRHDASPALLTVLTPLFRHDHQRDAWILRAVGHWYGPVLRRRSPGLRRQPPPPDNGHGGAGSEAEIPRLAIRPRRK